MNKKENFNKKIKKFYASLESSQNFSLTLEKTLLNKLKKQEREEYFGFKETFLKLRDALKQKYNPLFLYEVVKELKSKGSDRPLSPEESLIWNDILKYLERQKIILNVLKKSSMNEIKLSSIEENFDKYVLSNFYRTFCELSLRLFREILTIILVNEKRDGLIKRLNKDSLGLEGLKETLAIFDNQLTIKLELSRTIDEVFLYNNRDGFSLRNDIAHEKKFLNEFNNQNLIDQIMRVNRFNLSFVMIFYLEPLSEFFGKEEIDVSKKFLRL